MPVWLLVVKKVLAFFLCYIAGLLIAEGVVILLHFAFGKNMLVGDVFDDKTITLITYYGYIVMLGVALLYWKVIEKRSFSEMGITRGFGSYFVGAVTGVFLVAVSVTFIVLSGNIEYRGVFENADIPVIFLLIGGFAVQGAAEEILCRGIVFHSLKEKTSIGIAADISTVTFILPHLPSLFDGDALCTLFGILNLLLISTVFTLLTVGFKSIWAACGLHSFWNVALYGIFGLNLSGNGKPVTAVFNICSVGKNIWNGGEYGIEASIITTCVLAVFAALVWHAVRKRQSKIPIDFQ